MNGLTKAAQDVLAERQRQINAEGWTSQHDDEHSGGEMAVAAACYAAHSATWQAIQYTMNPKLAGIQHRLMAAHEFVGRMWPWAREWWKPKDDRSNLVRAAALLLAEIERLDRKADAAASHGVKEATAPQRETREVPPGKWKVDMPDGTYGRMPGDPPGPASVRAVIDGYVYNVEPRAGRLTAASAPRGMRVDASTLAAPDEVLRRATGVKTSDGGQPK